MNNRVNYITISSHRSGSSVFQRYLDKHDKVIGRQEDLRIDWAKGKNVDRDALYALLNNIYQSNHAYTAVGFKAQYSHLTPQLEEYIKREDIKVIHLIRNNILDTVFWYPGNYRGKTEGGFGPDLKLVSKTVEGKIPEICAAIKWMNMFIDEWEEKADFTVTYNQMTNNINAKKFYDEDKRKELWKFLNVKDSNHDLPQSKAERPNLKSCCVNYDEIIKELNKKGLRWNVEI